MKNAAFLIIGVVGLTNAPATANPRLLEEYWPMNSGDIRFYTGPAGQVYVRATPGFDAPFDFELYEYDEEAGEYYQSLSAGFGYSEDTVLEYGVDIGFSDFSWDPPLPVLSDTALADGAIRTFHTVLRTPAEDYPVTVTLQVANAGTVRVPAGTFHHCRTVKATARITALARTVSAEVWTLAPKVGQIRIGVVNGAGQLAGWQVLTEGTVGGTDVRELANHKPPVLAVTTPRVNQRLGSPLATIQGTARDDEAVSRVWFQLNDGPWEMAQSANGWTNWTASVELVPGTNSVRAYAEDHRGLLSRVLRVRFLYDPILPFVGSYHGLFHEAETLQHGSSGHVQAFIRPGGAFSMSLRSGSRRLAFAGRLGLDGKSVHLVPRPGANALTVELCLALDGSDQLTGRVGDGLWSADLLANRSPFNARTNPATNFAGSYTMQIPGSTSGSATEPAGHGLATVTISRAGVLTLLGTLADGAPAVFTTPISQAGDAPLYVPLYSGAGSALGWLKVFPSEESDLGGQLAWFRPARNPPATYTNGFVLMPVAIGSTYTPVRTNRLFEAAQVLLTFTEAGLASPLDIEASLGPGGRLTNNSPHKVTFRAVSATGAFNGTVLPPDALKPVAFKGVLLQKQGFGGGHFLKDGQSGAVLLVPSIPE